MSDYRNVHMVFKIVRVGSASVDGDIVFQRCRFNDSILIIEEGATVIFEPGANLGKNVLIQNHGKIIKKS